jgi:predicted DNA-binding WGR domain protein
MTRFTGSYNEYTYVEGTSHKFWRAIWLNDNDNHITFGVSVWGKIGADGQAKFHRDASELYRKIDEKQRKGYTKFSDGNIEVDLLHQQGGRIPYKYAQEFNTMLAGIAGQSTPEIEVVNENHGPVDISAEATRLIQQTIEAAHKDPADAVVKLHDLNSTVAALEAQLEAARGGQEIADAVVRQALR